MTIVGIDLGNQYTKIYQIKNGHPQIVFNEQTGGKIHSNIVFKDKDRFFGQDGHDKICKNLKTSLYHLRSWLTGIDNDNDNDNDNQLLSLYDYSKQNDLADFNLYKVYICITADTPFVIKPIYPHTSAFIPIILFLYF